MPLRPQIGLSRLLHRAGYATRSIPGRKPRAAPPRNTLPKPTPLRPSQKRAPASGAEPSHPPQSGSRKNAVGAVSAALRDADTQSNSLLAPVNIPKDPHAVLHDSHPATAILANSSIVITRQLELMNVMIGFEQANKYVIMDPQGNHIGYMAEQELGMGNMMARQMFSTHRSFTTHVFDKHGEEVLRFHRPFSWISSRIGVYDPLETRDGSSPSTDQSPVMGSGLTTELNQNAVRKSTLPITSMRIIGEAQQQWAPLRRKYNLFLYRGLTGSSTTDDAPQLTSGHLPLSNSKSLQPVLDSDQPTNESQGQFSQFAYIDEPFLSWDFSLLSQDSRLLGSVNRNFAGFGREIFTDTGVYALRMDAAALTQEPGHIISQTAKKAEVLQGEGESGMTLDQRAMMLATAVSVDFDYFSRHSGGSGIGGGFLPIWFPGGGGASGEAGGAVEGAEGAEGAGREVSGAIPENAKEGAAAGAGSLAGYESMQQGYRGDDASPTAGHDQAPFDQPSQGPGGVGQGEDVWGWDEKDDPWGGKDSGGGGDGGGDGGWLDWF